MSGYEAEFKASDVALLWYLVGRDAPLDTPLVASLCRRAVQAVQGRAVFGPDDLRTLAAALHKLGIAEDALPAAFFAHMARPVESRFQMPQLQALADALWVSGYTIAGPVASVLSDRCVALVEQGLTEAEHEHWAGLWRILGLAGAEVSPAMLAGLERQTRTFAQATKTVACLPKHMVWLLCALAQVRVAEAQSQGARRVHAGLCRAIKDSVETLEPAEVSQLLVTLLACRESSWAPERGGSGGSLDPLLQEETEVVRGVYKYTLARTPEFSTPHVLRLSTALGSSELDAQKYLVVAAMQTGSASEALQLWVQVGRNILSSRTCDDRHGGPQRPANY